jgi:hypothetical protein
MTARPRAALSRRLGALLAVSGATAVLGLTLFPSPEQTGFSALTPLLCIVCGEHGGADVFLNLLLFTPMAAGLRLLGWSWRRVVVASALLSFVVELLQYSAVPGRDASLSDLLTNTAGAAIAAAIAPRLGRFLVPDRLLAGRLFFGALALWLGVLIVSALVLMPWAPAVPLRNDCTASPERAEIFSGTARSVMLNDILLPCDDELPDGVQLREALSRGRATLDVVALSASPSAGRQVIHTVRAPGGLLLVLAQQGRTVVFSAPTAGLRLRLYSPAVSLPGAFPLDEGIPVELHAGVRDRRMWVSSSYSGGEQRMTELALSPSQGWSTILPFGIQPGRRLGLTTALWIAGLMLPAAYWAGSITRPAWGWGGVAAAQAAGLGALPTLTGFAPAHWSEWAGGVLGAALGWALHRFAAYLQSRCGSPSTSEYSSS